MLWIQKLALPEPQNLVFKERQQFAVPVGLSWRANPQNPQTVPQQPKNHYRNMETLLFCWAITLNSWGSGHFKFSGCISTGLPTGFPGRSPQHLLVATKASAKGTIRNTKFKTTKYILRAPYYLLRTYYILYYMFVLLLHEHMHVACICILYICICTGIYLICMHIYLHLRYINAKKKTLHMHVCLQIHISCNSFIHLAHIAGCTSSGKVMPARLGTSPCTSMDTQPVAEDLGEISPKRGFSEVVLLPTGEPTAVSLRSHLSRSSTLP